MLVTVEGMVMLVRLVQYPNALSPIVVRPSGSSISVKALQVSKAWSPMLVTLPIVTVLKLVHCANALAPMLLIYGILTSSNSAQFLNAPTSILPLAVGRLT